MRYKELLYLLLIFISGSLHAQSNFKPGFIIQTSGDTIFGEIDHRGDMLMNQLCRFKPKGQSNELKYNPRDILAYRFIDGKYYVSKEYNGRKYFIEFLVNGIVSMYFLRTEDAEYYLIEKEGHELVEIPYQEGIKKVGSSIYQYSSSAHVGVINYYMQDAPEFYNRIAEIKKPTHNNLINLAEDYHYKVCDTEKCIVYEKKLPIKVNVEVVGGINRFFNTEEYYGYQASSAGIIANVWLPLDNEKLYLRTGIITSKIDFYYYNKPSERFYKIPFQFEYIYPKGFISPRVAAGWNIYTKLGIFSFALMGGFNLKISKNFYLSFIYDLDFLPNQEFIMVPKTPLSNSMMSGLYINL